MVNPELQERLRARKLAQQNTGAGFSSSSQSTPGSYRNGSSSAGVATPISQISQSSYANSSPRSNVSVSYREAAPLNHSVTPAQNIIAEEEVSSRVHQAQDQLERLRREQEAVEKEQHALEELKERQETYTEGSQHTRESLEHAVNRLEREITEGERRLEQCRAARESLSSHYSQVHNIRPELWDQENLNHELDVASGIVDAAQNEIDRLESQLQFISNLSTSGRDSGGLFYESEGTAFAHLKAGFFFTLPLILTGLGVLYFFLNR